MINTKISDLLSTELVSDVMRRVCKFDVMTQARDNSAKGFKNQLRAMQIITA